MPTGFTSATTDSPQGLPVNMALLFKKNKTQNAFGVAKQYEAAQSVTKLPNNTPYISYTTTTSSAVGLASIINNRYFILILIYQLVSRAL